MAERKVAIRLGTEGKGEVKNDFAEVRKSGEDAMSGVTQAAEQAASAADRAADRQVAAWKRQAAAAKAAAVSGGNQDAISAALGAAGSQQFATVNLDRSAGSARQSAAAFEAFFHAEEEAEAGAMKVRAALDPLWAAQQRVNAAMEAARAAFGAGRISADQLAAYEKKLADETVHAGNAHQGASVQMMMFHSAMLRTLDSVSAGQHWSTILVQQGNEVAAALGMGGPGMGGKMKAVGEFMAGPWGLAVMFGAGVLGMLIPKLFDAGDAADHMAEHQKLLAGVIDQTTGRVIEQNRALLLNASIMSGKDAKEARENADRARSSILARARGSSLDFSANVGAVGAVHATTPQDPQIVRALEAFGKDGDGGKLAQSLDAIGKRAPALKRVTDEIIAQSAAYVTADRTAQQYEAQQRLTAGTAKPGDQRIALGQFGPEKPDAALLDAEAKLAAATTRRGRAQAQATIDQIKAKKALDDGSLSADAYRAIMTKADAAVEAASTHTDRHAQTLARDASAMRVNAAAGFDLAEAYLKGGSAAIVAEAQRKAATDATKKGIGEQAQVERQLAINVADGAVAGAKAVAQMRDENAARSELNAKVEAGTLPASRLNEALQDETTLRPLLKLQAVAQGEAYEALTRIIDAYREALGRAHTEERRSTVDAAADASRRTVTGLRDQVQFAGQDNDAASIELVRRAAQRDVDADPTLGSAHVDQKVAEERARLDAEHAKSVADAVRSEQDRGAAAAYALSILGKSSTEQDRLNAKFEWAQQQAHLIGRNIADLPPELVKAHDAAEEAAAQLKFMAANYDELRQTGGQVVDTLFNPSNWKNWGEAGKSIIHEVEAELLKLAIINPLKNMLEGAGGDKLPTLSSISKIFGHNASGTESWSGGMTFINENGKEAVDLPRGSRIYNAADTRRMMAAGNDNSGGGGRPYFDLRNAVLTPDLLAQMNAIGQTSALQGAHGGAQMASQDAARRGRRRLGRG